MIRRSIQRQSIQPMCYLWLQIRGNTLIALRLLIEPYEPFSQNIETELIVNTFRNSHEVEQILF